MIVAIGCALGVQITRRRLGIGEVEPTNSVSTIGVAISRLILTTVVITAVLVVISVTLGIPIVSENTFIKAGIFTVSLALLRQIEELYAVSKKQIRRKDEPAKQKTPGLDS